MLKQNLSLNQESQSQTEVCISNYVKFTVTYLEQVAVWITCWCFLKIIFYVINSSKECQIGRLVVQIKCTVEPLYNEVLGTMKITLLYQVSHIRVKKTNRAGTSKITLL